jgi:hypothetical protein
MLQIFDRQGYLDIPGDCWVFPHTPRGAYWFLIPVREDASLGTVWQEREHWVYRLHLSLVMAWCPSRSCLYKVLCQFDSYQSGPPGLRFMLCFDTSFTRISIPQHLFDHVPTIAAFELDEVSWPIYHDWCLDHNWSERWN